MIGEAYNRKADSGVLSHIGDNPLIITDIIMKGGESTIMMKKILVLAFAVIFLAVGIQAYAAEFSAGAMKQIEELKLLSRDKKDIPESFAGVKKITAAELKSWIDQKKKFVLLDNRVPADYEKEHIAGAIRLSPDDLMEKGIKAAEQVGLKKDDTIVFY